ncbi:hypothetical protein [Sphingomonas sp. C3-2]|uniref:hypothetical protein n=1 Tax=Sphingomonas sp. C3-2 TaxID=3062169 RepID=UPI00294AE1EC|nr:hypothetical protein [Sphingomonas sp. C3-2]WOK37800.1 hypothetical protein QYC26_06300 [Sphingomonas sp. C3-2]
MKTTPPPFEPYRATDSFAALVAGLSAQQSASTTARHQMMLGRGNDIVDADLLMMNAREKGSFDASVARSLREPPLD